MMAKITFYAKPGCMNNVKQKRLLAEAGHDVSEKNLLTEAWTEARLLAFFNHLPVKSWINLSAPEVKSGEIDPDRLTVEQAMRYMLQKPILIRRPLLEIDNERLVGFDSEQVNKRLQVEVSTYEDLETCPKVDKHSPCKPS